MKDRSPIGNPSYCLFHHVPPLHTATGGTKQWSRYAASYYVTWHGPPGNGDCVAHCQLALLPGLATLQVMDVGSGTVVAAYHIDTCCDIITIHKCDCSVPASDLTMLQVQEPTNAVQGFPYKMSKTNTGAGGHTHITSPPCCKWL